MDWDDAGQAGRGALRSVRTRIVVLTSFALASVVLSACRPSIAPSPVLARHCFAIGGGQETTLEMLPRDSGVLRVTVEERGISVSAELDGAAGTTAESPIKRFGTLVMVAPTAAAGRHFIRVRGADSHDLTGEICVSADLIHSTDKLHVHAETEMAAAGHATHGDDWESAFAAYLNAARAFDRLGEQRQAAIARHSMAEIAHIRLDRKRDSAALAAQALAETLGQGQQQSDPIFPGLLVALRAKALMDMPGANPRAVAPTVRSLLATARRYDSASHFGARELPRLDIVSGFLEYRLDAPDRARELFSKAAQRCREMGDWDCYGYAAQNSALLAEESRNYAFALAAYSEALRLLPPDLDPKLRAYIWTNLGRLQGVVGMVSSSERSYASAVRAFAQLGDCAGVRVGLARTGNLLVQVGSLADAKSNLEQAASLQCGALLKAVGAAPSEQTPYPAVAQQQPSLRSQENRPDGHAQPCVRPLDPEGLTTENRLAVFNSLLSLADASMLEGDVEQTRQCLDAAAPYAGTARPKMRLANERGAVFLERGDAQAARDAYRSALRIADDAKLPATHEHRGLAQLGLAKSALLARDSADVLQDARDALKLSARRGDIEQTITSLRLIGAAHRQSGDQMAAAHTLTVAADLIEAVPIGELDGEKRATYLATQHSVFAELTDLLASRLPADTATTRAAFVMSERGRARSLRYAITQSARDTGIDAPASSRYQQLLREMVSLPAEDSNNNHDAARPGTPDAAKPNTAPDRLIDELDRAALQDLGAPDQFDGTQLTATLRQLDATLVEYAVGPQDLFAFVVGPDGAPAVFRLGDRLRVASTAGQLRDLLRDPESPPEEIRAAARQLAQTVLWPLRERLAGRRILFVPDDALHTVPFAILPWSAESPQDLVLHHAEISIIPSALFLARAHASAAAHPDAPRIELIGDPVFRTADWQRECVDTMTSASRASVRTRRTANDWTESLPRLPGTRAEVSAIAKLAREARSGSRVEMAVGCAAVPAALRRAATDNVDLLHIATHARIDAQRPRLSALALTPDSGTGDAAAAFGLLDILGLKLDSRLVVLSACDTSRGRLLPGEGVLGPAQAFLQAGAASVLASYWRVDDQVTSSFMQQFYRYLLIDHLPASSALRKAQLERAKLSLSYEWAAFALYGWPDSSI